MDGVPIAVVENDALYLVRTDHIGRPVFATDDTGTVVWTASYLPFGGVYTTTGTPMELRFPGQWYQSETGLHQNWMRDYDPTTGRYIQADPLGLVDGASVYGYALQNPGRYVDPRGENAMALCGLGPWGCAAGIGITGGAAAWRAYKAYQAIQVLQAALAAGVDTVPQVRARVEAAEAAGQCPDPCDKARVRVDDAKSQQTKINGSSLCMAQDTVAILFSKLSKWREECNARRERDRVCPSNTNPNPPVEHDEKGKACSNATECAIMLSARPRQN